MPTLPLGVTRDSTGAPLGGVTVKAFDAATDALVASGVSDASGNYSLTVPGLGPYYVSAYKDASPFVAGATRRDLVPVADSAATVMNLWTGVPTTDGVVLTAKMNSTNTANSTRVAVSTSETLSSPTYTTAVTPDATYRFAKHTITGKTATTEYWYCIEVDGVLDLATKGRFKTLPAAGAAANFSIVVGGCSENTNDSAFAAINALPTKPLFLLAMGDFQYMDIATPTLANYHAAFDASLVYGARKVTHSQIPTVHVFDDHDFGTDNSTGRDASNVAKSFRSTALAFARARIPNRPASATATDTLHQSFVVGRVRFVLSDLRSDKTAQTATDDASKTMMGAAQKTWWKAEIDAAKAAGQIVAWGNSVPWVVATAAGDDTWAGYNTERVELADYIKAAGMAGQVFILSSDMHALAYHTGADYATGGGAAIPVFHCGPFNRAASQKGGPYTANTYPGAGNSSAVRQYATLDVTDNGTTMTISWKGFSADGTQRMAYSFTATPGAATPSAAPAKMAKPTAVAGDGQVTLTLTAPNDGGSPITKYTITNMPAGAVDQQANTTALTRVITGLANAVSRQFGATATNDVGTSPVSDLSDPVTPVAASAGTAGVFDATGGTISTPGDGYKYWTFLAGDTLNVTNAGPVEYLVVAGGGAGGAGGTSAGGGGGAGGLLQGSMTLSVGALAIAIGAGGVAGAASTTQPGNGGDSSIGTLITSLGGGSGAAGSLGARTGGSGGGGSSVATALHAAGTTGQGNAGTDGVANSGSEPGRSGGGGGGAGSVASNAIGGTGGNGGEGVTVWGRTLAGGGGGGGGTTPGVGKAGGGNGSLNAAAAAGTANTGGGGGSAKNGAGGDGGSGIVIIRRPL